MRLKTRPEDFIVSEILGFDASNTGQHLLLHIEKTNLNTFDVIQHLSSQLKIPIRDIGYCGLKDRQAITSQFFSVDLKGKIFTDFNQLATSQIKILSASPHHKKLKIGCHQTNKFKILIRDVTEDKNSIDAKLTAIKTTGVPNLFGEQRFGRNNLELANKMLAGQFKVKSKFKQGMFISTLRAYLFNQICLARIANNTWDKIIAGDIVLLNGSNSLFYADSANNTGKLPADLTTRANNLEIHPTAALFGVGTMHTTGQAQQIEAQIMLKHKTISDGLVKLQAKLAHRALRMRIYNLNWQWLDNNLQLEFSLNKGSFATVLIKYLFN